MRFTISAAAVVAFASSVLAQDPTSDFDPITEPALNEAVPAGQTFNIQWTSSDKYADELIDIALIGGPDQKSLVPVTTVATGVKNSDGSYAWDVDSDLGDDALYGLVFTLESDPTVLQYSVPFTISGGSGGSSDNSSASASASASASTSDSQTVTASSSASPTSGNSSITPSIVKSTSTATQKSSPTTSSTQSSSTAAAAHATAGAMAALGGLALAALAL